MAAKSQVNETNTKLWLWGLSALYLIGYFLLMKETKVCAPAADVFIRAHWFLGFWDQYFACRTINELGDALAGAFAPVAFIWLAGAVQIQSLELKAQREELDETQDVMRQQLEVARAQVEETRASTSLFGIQTKLLQDEHSQRTADAYFDKFLFGVRRDLQNIGSEFSASNVYGKWQFSPPAKSVSHADFFDYLVGRLEVFHKPSIFEDLYVIENKQVWVQLYLGFNQLLESSLGCSSAVQHMVTVYHLNEIADMLKSAIYQNPMKQTKDLPDLTVALEQ